MLAEMGRAFAAVGCGASVIAYLKYGVFPVEARELLMIAFSVLVCMAGYVMLHDMFDSLLLAGVDGFYWASYFKNGGGRGGWRKFKKWLRKFSPVWRTARAMG